MICFIWLIVLFVIICLVENQVTIVDPQVALGGLTRTGTFTSNTSPTVDLSKKELKEECLCDLTKFACDYLCCCDPECPDDAKVQWNNTLNNVCAEKRINKCYITSIRSSSISIHVH